jgi:NAD(P)-dependent dehydrogenase (short-subunit alcohol dehydrogenase family)
MHTEGSAALVSGGASGLGEATVRRLAAAGAAVTICDVNAELGAGLADQLSQGSGRVRFVRCDVTDSQQVAEAVAVATEDAPLRVCVNCAGIGVAARTVARDGTPHDFELFMRVININLVGTFNTLRYSASVMARNEPRDDGERGVIINTASIAAYDGQIGQLAYAASKGAIVGMTLPAARDLSTAGIRVVSIAPGFMDTPLIGMLPPALKEALGAGVPFPKRLGLPDDFAQLAMHIVENRYLNGEVIRLDGAFRMPPK